MVVGPAEAQLTGSLGFRIVASVTTTLRAQGFFRDPAGRLVPFSRTFAHSAGDRTVETGTLVADTRQGIVALDVTPEAGAADVKRGQAYVEITLTAVSITNTLARGYVSTEVPLTLGQYVEPGPGGGEGFRSWVQVFHDRAGNAAAVDYALAATNALRKVYGLAWYYHADNTVATRTVYAPILAGLGGTKPTGFTLTGNNANFWTHPTDITLTADEEGARFLYSTEGKDGRSVLVDTGTMTVDSSATSPTPFPLTVTEDDTDTIIRFPAINLGVATDTHSAYVLTEEWLVL